jgi:peptidoglycan/LPS O-acetylase OafA/YrhL
MEFITHRNNLGWLRLLFASQVMVVHVFAFLVDYDPVFLKYFNNFPGVPAFFFVSGLLIYASYDRNRSARHFAKKRFLRIWPGLIVVSVAGLAVVVLAHSGSKNIVEQSPTYLVWFISQITLGQAWNPASFRDVGNGVINGALWTITVDILFYISVPIIVFFEQRFKYIILVLLLCSFLFYSFGDQFMNFKLANDKTAFAYLSLTPIVWGWMFLTGVLAYKHFELLKKFLPYFYLAIIPIAILITLDIQDSIWFTASHNGLGAIYFLSLCSVVMFLGFRVSYVKLDADLSYGVYLWHMVIINFLLVVGFRSLPTALFLTYIAAFGSWYFVEKRFFVRKKILPSTGAS